MTDEHKAVIQRFRWLLGTDDEGVFAAELWELRDLLAALDAAEAERDKARCEIAELHDIVSAFHAITDPEAFPKECEQAHEALTRDSADHTICNALREAEAERDALRTNLEATKLERDGYYAEGNRWCEELDSLRAQLAGAPWLGIYRTSQEMADALTEMRADLAAAREKVEALTQELAAAKREGEMAALALQWSNDVARAAMDVVDDARHWLEHGPKLRAVLKAITTPMVWCAPEDVPHYPALVVCLPEAQTEAVYRATVDALAASDEPKPMPRCEGTSNPYVAPCGARFDTYEEMAAHRCEEPKDA